MRYIVVAVVGIALLAVLAAAHDEWHDERERLKRENAELRELAERYIEPPLDADGVPIKVGDVLDCDANGYKGTFSVFAIGDNVVVGNHPEEFWFKRPMDTFHVARFCHHHEPTVEDVLREFSCVLMGKQEFDGDVTEAIAEYAAKLRSAGEE